MADLDSFDVLPGHHDDQRAEGLWVPRQDTTPPNFLLFEDYIEAKEELDRYFAVAGFTISIDETQDTLLSKHDTETRVKACSLCCSHAREEKKESAGKRSHASTSVTRCEWKGRLEPGRDPITGEMGYLFTIVIPAHNHDRVHRSTRQKKIKYEICALDFSVFESGIALPKTLPLPPPAPFSAPQPDADTSSTTSTSSPRSQGLTQRKSLLVGKSLADFTQGERCPEALRLVLLDSTKKLPRLDADDPSIARRIGDRVPVHFKSGNHLKVRGRPAFEIIGEEEAPIPELMECIFDDIEKAWPKGSKRSEQPMTVFNWEDSCQSLKDLVRDHFNTLNNDSVYVTNILHSEQVTIELPDIIESELTALRVEKCFVSSNLTLSGKLFPGHIGKPQHIDSGKKLWLFFPPHDDNLNEFYKNEQEVNLQLVKKLKGRIFAVASPGDAFFLPSGWIHWTYALTSGVCTGISISTGQGLETFVSILCRELKHDDPQEYEYERFRHFFRTVYCRLSNGDFEASRNALRELCPVKRPFCLKFKRDRSSIEDGMVASIKTLIQQSQKILQLYFWDCEACTAKAGQKSESGERTSMIWHLPGHRPISWKR